MKKISMFHAEKDTHEEEDMESQKRQGAEYEFYGKLPLKKAIPLGLQHVLAMFVGNLTPILIISGACGIAGEEFGSLQVDLLQNAMLIAGIVTLIQLFAIGPVGGKVPIIMGTSSGFIGVFNSVVQVMGGGILAYGAIMCESVIGGLFEGILGFLLKPLRRFFPAVVTGTVVLSIGLSLIAVGVNSFGGGNTANDFGSVENLLLGAAVLLIIVAVKHWMKGMASASSILIGIVAGYIIAAATTQHASPRDQALVSMTGPFWDTVVMCAITGIASVSSMITHPGNYAGCRGSGCVLPYSGNCRCGAMRCCRFHWSCLRLRRSSDGMSMASAPCGICLGKRVSAFTRSFI